MKAYQKVMLLLYPKLERIAEDIRKIVNALACCCGAGEGAEKSVERVLDYIYVRGCFLAMKAEMDEVLAQLCREERYLLEYKYFRRRKVLEGEFAGLCCPFAERTYYRRQNALAHKLNGQFMRRGMDEAWFLRTFSDIPFMMNVLRQVRAGGGELADKAVIYEQAIEKYDSARAKYNLGVAYICSNDLANAKAALAKADKDADWQNAMGVIALREGDNAAAAKYFAASGNATSKENAAVLDILNGKYADAAAKLASADNCCNKVLAYILTDQLDKASAAATCGCAKTSYLKAVIAARQGKADDVKKYINEASKDKDLAERATKDIEFAQYR